MELTDIQLRLRECIRRSGITQKELAKKIWVSAHTVSKYMKADVFPSLDTFAKLCSALDVSANYVLGLGEY